MIPEVVASSIFATAVVCWGLGLLAGYHMGRKQKMTRTEAARIMARASWKNRISAGRTGFFRTVNK